MDPPRVHQLRIVVEAPDFDEALAFFRDVLGLPETAAFVEGGDDRVAILDAGRATLELASPTHEVAIDRVEASGRPSPRIRLGFEVADTEAETDRLVGPALSWWRGRCSPRGGRSTRGWMHRPGCRSRCSRRPRSP